MEILGHSDIKRMKRCARLDKEHTKRALARLPEWNGKNRWHKSGTSEEGKEKRLRAERPQSLGFIGAEEGS